MSGFARGARLSVESLETRETPSTIPSVTEVLERSNSWVAGTIQVATNQSQSGGPERERTTGVLIFNFYTSGAASGNTQW